ncbi:hypothetical protein [Stenotrophomonas sp.]|uniref:hypothetical protein n=1 Tax=Stenotrophomonas sp. TaxID=69392 RepID=UPI0028ACB728|nr:hypothetical protein [Stenotrophomonas sp.]
MNDWTKTKYGTPKSWDEIQREKRDEELAKNSSSPLWPAMGVMVIGALSLGCILLFIGWAIGLFR